MGATSRLGTAGSIDELVWAERVAPLAYWTAWATISVTFAKRDSRVVPEQWHGFEQRGSLLTSSPRLAINPANAILNYLYAILEAQTRLACLTVGLDPGLGIVHADYRDRDSFALDLMEAARPAVDAYVFTLLTTRTFIRREFAETARGVCRINPPLSQELAETAPRWAEAIAPAAEAVAQLLASTEGSRVKRVSTPLPGRNKLARYGKSRRRPTPKGLLRRGSRCRPANVAMLLSRAAAASIARTACLTPAGALQKAFHGSGLAAIEEKTAAGEDPTHGATAASRRAESNVIRKREAREWDQRHGKLVDVSAFQRDILPLIEGVPLSRLQQATGLSLTDPTWREAATPAALASVPRRRWIGRCSGA